MITLAHGSGGKLTHRLLEEIFFPAFKNSVLDLMHDGAFLTLPTPDLVFTTDSFVIQPLFFPGGDIGKLSVTGTANDLAMCGAKPCYISAGFIIEEGFLQSDLQNIVLSMGQEAQSQAIQIVTGDTKVIERHTGTNLFINTSGIGFRLSAHPIHPGAIRENDTVILSGDIGRHGMAVMAEREHLSFTHPLVSDCAPLFPLVEALLNANISVHCLRDTTRGGLATALVELAESSKLLILVEEDKIPICSAVEASCEILGFDPLYVACEGRMITFVPEKQADQTVNILRTFPQAKDACIIGKVSSPSLHPVALIKNAFGASRILHRLIGDQLPRIC